MNGNHGKDFEQAVEPAGIAAIVDRYVSVLSPRQGNGAPSPVRTGLSGLDRNIGGLHAGELTVLAARPGTGKTSLALQIALNAARSGSDVAYFSLERSARHLGMMLLSQTSGVPLESLGQQACGAIEVGRLSKAADDLVGLGMRVYDASGVSSQEIETAMDVHSRCPGGALCVVDYIQLVKGPGANTPGRTDSEQRAHEIERVVLGLKTMAEALRIPVLVLSTLPRAVGLRDRRRPRMEDFRNPSVVLGADTLLLLDRSLSPEEAAVEHRPGEAEATVIVAKNGHGSCRDHRLAFDGNCLAFSELPDPAGTELGGAAPA